MKTKQMNFRLSKSAQKNLAIICQVSGINQTAAVEMALAALVTGLTKGENTMLPKCILIPIRGSYLRTPATWEQSENQVLYHLDDHDALMAEMSQLFDLTIDELDQPETVWVEPLGNSLYEIDGNCFTISSEGWLVNAPSPHIINQYGVQIDYDAAVNIMDDDVREVVHMDIAPCTNQEFFNAYCQAHKEKFGEPWELDKPNPVW